MAYNFRNSSLFHSSPKHYSDAKVDNGGEASASEAAESNEGKNEAEQSEALEQIEEPNDNTKMIT